jgi:hypothetical protein
MQTSPADPPCPIHSSTSQVIAQKAVWLDFGTKIEFAVDNRRRCNCLFSQEGYAAAFGQYRVHQKEF